MAQITLTLDLTVETAEALRVLAVALNGPQAKTGGEPEQMKLEDFDKPDEKPAKPATKPPTKPAAAPKKDDKKPEAPADEKPAGDAAISLTDVRAVALKLSNGGKKEALQEVFAKYGAKKLSDIPQADYPALMEDLEEALNG